jgi:molybdopterin synthase catalytic subunit
MDGALPTFEQVPEGGETGSEVIFMGRVRNMENDHPIVALFYEAFEPMAMKELQMAADETAEKFEIQDLFCWHRIGEVPVGEPSLKIVIRSHHREAGLEAVAWLVREIKLRVPIWKWGVAEDGERFPSRSGIASVSGN